MTLRFSIRDRGPAPSDTLARLVWAGGGVCCCCANPFVPLPTKNGEPTVEHVFPQSPRGADLTRLKELRALVINRFGKPQRDRKAAAHAKCNRAKGNRPPTGCEIVFLMSVNDRLHGLGGGIAATQVYADATERRKMKRRRQAARKRAAKMQAMLAP